MAHRQWLQDGEQIPCGSTFQSRADSLGHSWYLQVLSSPSFGKIISGTTIIVNLMTSEKGQANPWKIRMKTAYPNKQATMVEMHNTNPNRSETQVRGRVAAYR